MQGLRSSRMHALAFQSLCFSSRTQSCTVTSLGPLGVEAARARQTRAALRTLLPTWSLVAGHAFGTLVAARTLRAGITLRAWRPGGAWQAVVSLRTVLPVLPVGTGRAGRAGRAARSRLPGLALETLRALGTLRARLPRNANLSRLALGPPPALGSLVARVTFLPPRTSISRQTYRARRPLVANHPLRTCSTRPPRPARLSVNDKQVEREGSLHGATRSAPVSSKRSSSTGRLAEPTRGALVAARLERNADLAVSLCFEVRLEVVKVRLDGLDLFEHLVDLARERDRVGRDGLVAAPGQLRGTLRKRTTISASRPGCGLCCGAVPLKPGRGPPARPPPHRQQPWPRWHPRGCQRVAVARGAGAPARGTRLDAYHEAAVDAVQELGAPRGGAPDKRDAAQGARHQGERCRCPPCPRHLPALRPPRGPGLVCEGDALKRRVKYFFP